MTAPPPDPPSPVPDDDDSVARIIRAWREIRRRAADSAMRGFLLGGDGGRLDLAQVDALEILSSSECGWRMSEFADALRVDPSTATRAVDRLERLGLAERAIDRTDRRIVVATATVKGRRVLKQLALRRRAGVQQMLRAFDADEQEQLAGFLERFVASLDDLSDEIGRRR